MSECKYLNSLSVIDILISLPVIFIKAPSPKLLISSRVALIDPDFFISI